MLIQEVKLEKPIRVINYIQRFKISTEGLGLGQCVLPVLTDSQRQLTLQSRERSKEDGASATP